MRSHGRTFSKFIRNFEGYPLIQKYLRKFSKLHKNKTDKDKIRELSILWPKFYFPQFMGFLFASLTPEQYTKIGNENIEIAYKMITEYSID